MAGNYPKIGKTPLELFENRNARPESFLERHGWTLYGAVIGALFPIFYKGAINRPLTSGK